MKERKTFTFDGENSADYGLYISGDSVYNAPNREIDMVSIPGRNGQLAIDMGRYENITVTYPAFVFADTQEEFREKIRRIRNWLCSKTSYQRLTDEYNPESFRLGLYKSGLEVEPIFYNRCGEFEMSFDCKPQRFLFTGEEVFTLGEWGETETYSGSIVSFEGTETTAVKSLTAQIVPKQSGSGDPSPINERPISGYDTVVISNSPFDSSYPNPISGKNIFMGNRFDTITPCRIEYGQDFVASASASCGIRWYDENKVLQDYWSSLPNTSADGRKYRTYRMSSPGGCYYFEFYGSGAPTDLMVELGTTPSPYEPFGYHYDIPLGQTVYGGTLEVMSGKLVSDMATPIDLGSLEWRRDSNSGTYYFYATLSTPCAYGYNTPASQLKVTALPYSYKGTGGWAYMGNKTYGFTYNTIRIRDDSYTDPTSFKASLTNVTFSYGVATPTEITLTPTQVKTLLGSNNIWADSGDVTVEIGENPYILVNPTKFEATPIFEVEGSGTLSVGDTTLTINNEGTTIIDTEMLEAYEDDNGAIISRNDDVEGGFPTLTSGINNVEADGLTSVKITPKWWEL